MRQLVKEKENCEFKPVKLRLKIDLVSYPARSEGLGKYDIVNTFPNVLELSKTQTAPRVTDFFFYGDNHRPSYLFKKKIIESEI